MTNTDMNRRAFIKGCGITAAGLGAIGMLSACSSGASGKTEGKEPAAEAQTAPASVDETVECDVCIVGGGLTGLAAAVQAALNGQKVLLMESQLTVGGNGLGVEGTFAANSQMQKDLGISFTVGDIVKSELAGSQWRADGLFWKDFISASGDNIAWLKEQGVEFSGAVESYGSPLGAQTFHWFKDNKASVGYVPQMEARCNELGVEIRVQTAGKSLIVENDKVTGIYAETTDGKNIQVNAPAIVLATGGFGSNNELIAKLGFDVDNVFQIGAPGHDGAGYSMAMAVGAEDFIGNATFNANSIILALPHTTPIDPINGCVGIGQGGPFLWVNQNGERFVDENLGEANFELQTVPGRNQKKMFTVFDSTIFEKWATARNIDVADALKIFEESLASNEADSFYSADTVEELAEKAGIDKQTFADTVARYNELCAKGIDEDFGKDAKQMQAIAEAPFYIGRVTVEFLFSCGGIGVNRNYEVVTPEGEPIPGLYAIGNDGNMLYRNVYTIDVPGTCSSSGIYGARTAANAAKEYIGGN